MERHAAAFKAFSDETRLRILFLLAERELCVCELVEALEMPQGKVSRHLAILRSADLVERRRDGTWMHYRLGEPSDPLRKRLFAYLTEDRETIQTAADDLARLRALADPRQLCDDE